MREIDNPIPTYVDPNPEMQKLCAEPQEGDDNPTAITVIQAQKCAAIITAARTGNDAYQPLLKLAGDFLNAAALETVGARMAPATEELWSSLAATPWPTQASLRPRAPLDR